MYKFLVVHQRPDERWVVSRMETAWEVRPGRKRPLPDTVRMKVLKTGGHYDSKACAVQWAKSHNERMQAQGFPEAPVLLQLGNGLEAA